MTEAFPLKMGIFHFIVVFVLGNFELRLALDLSLIHISPVTVRGSPVEYSMVLPIGFMFPKSFSLSSSVIKAVCTYGMLSGQEKHHQHGPQG